MLKLIHKTTCLFLFLIFSNINLVAQCDCAYPVIFIHGWTDDYTAFEDIYTNTNVVNAWGGLSDTYDAVLNATSETNAYGLDATKYTPDDDVLVEFNNDTNNVNPGCLYAMDFDWYWNEDQTNPLIQFVSVPAGESDSNQSAIEKQGWAVGEAIKKVLAANPTKKKVVLVGHSMGGLASREYLQRFENGTYTWWNDPSDPVDGHKVAKLVTVGTPHRGSNAGLANLGSVFNFDEKSEAVRDLRFSYDTGLFSPNDPAPYLFYGPEDDNVDDSWFKNGDIDCDGDYDTNIITSINEAGSGNAWDGTKDNPAMPLPTNVKYNYYTSYSAFDVTLFQFNGGDGAVADERQWIYTGGDGSTGDYNNGSSVPEPNDGVNHRLSDRVHSDDNVFHPNQPSDIVDVLRGMDEGDYPFFAYDINLEVDYAGFATKRADLVPNDSEFTNIGDNTVDGDWYKFEITNNTPGFSFSVTPHPAHAGRVDFYESTPGNYSNANSSTIAQTWGIGAGVQSFNSSAMCFTPGTYYIRISHTGMTLSSWETAYKFRVDPLPCEIPTNPMANTTALDATLTWDAVVCASQYNLRYRPTGTMTWTPVTVTNNSYLVSGLLPGQQYEYEVSADCGGGSTAFTAIIPFGTPSCPTTLYIPGMVTEGIYNIGMEITSDGTIPTTDNTTYFAGDFIELMPGFEVEAGANFLADIQGCVPFAGSGSSSLVVNDSGEIEVQNEKNNTIGKQKFYIKRIPLADKTIVFEYYLPDSKPVSIIYNEQIALQEKSNKSIGKYFYTLDTSDWEIGNHIVDFKIGEQVHTFKIHIRPELTDLDSVRE